jgi:phosphoribosylanthranilate isomerase
MFHTKICGIRTKADLESVSASGADAIGLNFFPNSVRFVDPDSNEAKTLSGAAQSAGLIRVGLFVNESIDSILRCIARIGLDAIQLHGDEEVEFAAELKTQTDLPIIRAIKLPLGPLSVELVSDKSYRWQQIGCLLLLDVDAGAAHGGSGKTLDWRTIRQWSETQPEIGWVLAGGLTPENVAQAIGASGAASVDVASGVEETRGEKSDRLIRQFAVERKKATN